MTHENYKSGLVLCIDLHCAALSSLWRGRAQLLDGYRYDSLWAVAAYSQAALSRIVYGGRT